MTRNALPNDPPSATIPARREWRGTGAALALLLAAILALYGPTFAAMAAIWSRSETFTHGFVVPLIVAWLLWRRRGRLAPLAPLPDFRVVLALIPAGLLWLLGQLASANAVSQLAVVLLLILVAVAMLGPRIAVRIAFPLGFLLFAVPVGEFAIPRLMDWTADFAVAGLRASGIPVYREGLSFVIPSGHWSVVEACSGVRYLLASLMVGTLFAYLNFRALWRRLTFIALSVAVPILANWARAYMIVMLGHLSGNRLAVGVDHLIYGWVFFGLVILLLFWIGARWAERAEPDGHLPEPPEPPWESRWTAGRLGGVAAAVFVAVLLPPLALAVIERGEAAAELPAALEVPAGDWGGWQPAAAAADFVPAYRNASLTRSLRLSRDGAEVDVYVAYYRQQTHERKLVTSTNAVLRADDPNWTVAAGGHRVLAVGGRELRVPVYELAPKASVGNAEQRRRTVMRWYWVAGQLCAGDSEAKIRTIWSRLLGRGDDSAVVVVSVADLPGQPAAAVLESFVREAAPALHAALDEVGAAR